MLYEIFDIVDDNNDELQYTDAELNRYFLSGHIDALLGDEVLIKPIDENDMCRIQELMNNHDMQLESSTEVILSQRLSQLSATNKEESVSKRPSSGTSENTSTTAKRIRTTDQQNETKAHESHDHENESDEELPNYLSLDSQLFVDLIHKLTRHVTTLSNNEIHEIALLKHRIGTLSIRKDLTETYLRSVTGTLLEHETDIQEIDRRVWPMEVQSLILTHRKRTTTTTATTGPLNISDENVQNYCENLLKQHLKERSDEIGLLEKKLQDKTQPLVAYSSKVNEIIDEFVETHSLKSLKLKRDYKISNIKYNFEAEILERQYQLEKPNSYQNEISKRLLELRRNLEKAKHEVLELKQRIFYNKPTPNLKLLISTTPEQQSTESEFLNREHIVQAHQILDSMCYAIRDAEEEYYRHQGFFDYELSQMWKQHRNLVKDRGMRTGLLNLLEKRFQNVTMRYNDVHNYRVDYYLKYAYESSHSEEQHSQPMSLSYNLLLSQKHPFTDQELQLLNRGPTYVPHCQMYVPSSDKSLDDLIKTFYAPFKSQLTKLFTKYHINIALTMEIQKKSFDLFKDLFTVPLPSHLQKRAIFEQYLIHSIYAKLHSHDLLVQRTADNMNTFYIFDRSDYHKRAQRYLTISDDYTLLVSTRSSQVNSPEEQNQTQLKAMIDSMNELLESLKTHKSVPNAQIKKLSIDASRVTLPYIQFLPDISKDPGIRLVPFIVSNSNSATWKIGQYIDQLLRPLVTGILKSTTFHDEIDFIRQLNTYTHTEHRLKPSTVFCSLKIKNFYAMDIHKNLIDTVGYFLQDHLVANRLENLSIQTIKNLLHIFLYYNVFSFNDDIYRIDRGGPQSMPLSETLSNIFIFMWQKQILKELQGHNELFGRCKDQIFFTWNKSSSVELFAFVQQIRENVRTVRFDIFHGTVVPFLNISVENLGTKLYTCVLHEPELQRYHLPYVSGHSKLAHSEWLRSALIRAACCSSSVKDFHEERIYLEGTFLVNGYSLEFIEKHIQHFFNYFNAPTMRYSTDSTVFDKFRKQWLDYMSFQHKHTEELQKFNDRGQIYELNYFYEYGPRCQFNEEFYQLWSPYFNKHPHLSSDQLKLQIKPKHFQTLNTLLCSKILKNLTE